MRRAPRGRPSHRGSAGRGGASRGGGNRVHGTRARELLDNLGVQVRNEGEMEDAVGQHFEIADPDIVITENFANPRVDAGGANGGDQDVPRVLDNILIQTSPRNLAVGSSSSSNGFRGFARADNPNYQFELRKRRLDLEIEESRARLRLIEAERESLNDIQRLQPENVSENSTGGTGGGGATVPDGRENIFFEKMVNIISSAIKDSQSTSLSANLVSRLTSRNETLTFSGNHVEWRRFKRAFEQSSEAAGYTERDNVERLYNCLKGEARESIEGLMLACASTEEIMRSLELRYGGNDIILRKLTNSLRNLPRLNAGETDIIAFASLVKNNVTALSVIERSYLEDRDLLFAVLRRMPEAMVYRYNEYATSDPGKASNLYVLAEFLSRQAEFANLAGTTHALEV